MDRIWQIVERAIDFTDLVLKAAPHHGAAARRGLEQLRDNLAQNAPDHPALNRLRNYIAALREKAPPHLVH